MMVEIFIVVDEHPEVPWPGEHLKGSVLMALGAYRKAPDKIEFRVSRKVKS